MERDCPGSLSSPLWSKLPLELLTKVVTQTTDTKTLDSWCEATRGSHHLYETAMTARWRTVTIDDRDLLPAPGDDENTFNQIQERLRRRKLGQRWKPAGKMVNTLLSTVNNKSGRCPANYVQDLVFDFRLLRYWEDDIQDANLDAHDLMPTVETLKHTLTKLRGHFHDLCYFSCYGDTPQVILDFAASQDAAKIRGLEMRSLGAYGRLQIDFEDEPPRQRYPLRRWPLRLEVLSTLHQLRNLDIHHLSNHETAGLLAALPRLIELRCLTLACEAEEHGDHYGGCALKSLFDQIFQDRGTVSINDSFAAECSAWLPPDLKSLSLIDTNHYSKSVILPFAQPPRSENHLTHLCVDIGNVDWVPMLVDCFSEGTLQFLSVPGCCRDGHSSVSGDHAYVDHAITKHKGSLNKVKLVRAWQTDRRWIDELNDRWQGKYAIQELVLGTRNSQWYSGFVAQWRELFPEPTLSHYLCGFHWNTDTKSGRWGDEIRRIRIDHVHIPDLDVSVISEPFYSRLKILMLQPAPRGTCYDGLPGCEAIDETVCVELARRIITHGALSLRVIVIATHWYWVSRDMAGSEHDNGLLWTWPDAKADSIQNELMSSILEEADLDFLERSTVPFWHERDSKEWHRNLPSQTHPHQPSIEMLNQWSYLTMLPLHET